MNQLATAFRVSRSNMVEMEDSSVSAEFSRRFGLSEGEYLEVRRNIDSQFRPCRILAVDNCYYNARGGFTATLKVLILLASGRTGTGRSIMVTTSANGTGLRGVHNCEVRRCTQP